MACNALVIIAEVEAAQGREEDCRQHARQADGLADEAGLRLLQVRARLMPALLEFGRGRLEEAITHYEIFDRLDARPWAERARAELRASGETMTGAGNDGKQLTPRELQIALPVSQDIPTPRSAGRYS